MLYPGFCFGGGNDLLIPRASRRATVASLGKQSLTLALTCTESIPLRMPETVIDRFKVIPVEQYQSTPMGMLIRLNLRLPKMFVQ